VTPAPLTLLPDLGDLLRLQPRYNAATLVEVARGLGAAEVLWLSSPDPDHPARDTFAAAGLPIAELAPDWAWADSEHAELVGFMKQYPQGQARLRQAARAEQDLETLLAGAQTGTEPDTQPGTQPDIRTGTQQAGVHTLATLTSPELLAGLRRYHTALADALDEGPGTRWQARRLDTLAQTLSTQVLDGRTGAALVALDDLPGLLDRLPHARLPDAAQFTLGESSRLRALADRALLLSEHDDLSALLAALEREAGDRLTPKSELQYAAGNIYLAVGDLKAARTLLEAAAHGLKGERSLPGLVLARLGQVRDAQGERDLALRTYRATLALSFAPQAARDAAQAGLETAFLLELE
jgi:tetratricopeptide (TPR) repeat protein